MWETGRLAGESEGGRQDGLVAGVEARTEKQYGGDAADHLREVSDLFEASMIAWVRGPRECEG
jgi:hypothetical protein